MKAAKKAVVKKPKEMWSVRFDLPKQPGETTLDLALRVNEAFGDVEDIHLTSYENA